MFIHHVLTDIRGKLKHMNLVGEIGLALICCIIRWIVLEFWPAQRE
jgi:hypothetical protein